MNLVYLIPALRIILGLLYIITAALKFPNMRGFSVVVAEYNLLPRLLVKPAAYVQPIIEFTIGVWILSGKYLLEGAMAGLALMVVADIFIIAALVQKKRLKNCGCYGPNIKVPLNNKKLLENAIWTLLFVILVAAANQMRFIY